MRIGIAIALALLMSGTTARPTPGSSPIRVRLKPDTTAGAVRLTTDAQRKPDTTAGAVRLTTDATAISSGSVRLQPDRNPIERGTLRLHYVGKAIGYERYSIVPDGDGVALSSDFDFTDRGGHVQLTATLRARPDYTPVAFKATGKSYRFVNVDSDIRIDGGDAVVHADGAETRVQVSAPFFTVDG